MSKRANTLHLIACGSLALAACSEKEPEPTASHEASDVEPSNMSVAAVLEDTGGLGSTAKALKDTGLTGIFAGKGSYTLLAPTDEAFAKIGDSREQLLGSGNTAALAALLKSHILPGYLSLADIGAAIDKSAGASVKMRSMAGEVLTFAKAGDAVTVTTADGVTARLGGDPIAGKGSSVLPIDAVLKKI